MNTKKKVCHKCCFYIRQSQFRYEFLKRGFSLNHVTFNASAIKAVLFLIRFHSRAEEQKSLVFLPRVSLDVSRQKREKSERKDAKEKREKAEKERRAGGAVVTADLPGKDAQQKSLQEPWPTNSVSILKRDVKTTPPSVQSEAALLRPPAPPHEPSRFSALCTNTGPLLVNYAALCCSVFFHI